VAAARWPRQGHLLVSPALTRAGVVAGMSTRALGSMGGAATAAEDAERARGALAGRLGFDAVVRVKQVHGDRVLRAHGPFDAPWPEADGIWTDRPGVLLGVVAADCVPVLVADGAGRIGAAHAGWEGTSRRIAQRLVEQLAAAGADPRRVTAALGPSIGPCCYTVGSERVALVRERLGRDADVAVVEKDGRSVLDLWAANAAQLRASGVTSLEVAGACTQCGGEDVFSRRGGDIGLLGLAFIGRPAPAGAAA
jgi:polyphenol oxidase